jgi:HEAT repeat protein
MPLFGPPNIAALEAKRDVTGLIKALAYKDPAVKIAAADALGPLRDPLAVEALGELVKDPDTGVRRAAVRALAARGGARVVPAMLAAMQDPDPGVREAASQAVFKRLLTDPDQDARRDTVTGLGQLRPAGATEPLMKAAQDPDESVRVAAIKALAALGDPAAVIPLLGTMVQEQRRARATGRSSPAIERAASQALDALCNEAAIDVLRRALGHEDADVREAALKRLARIGKPAVETLEATLDDPDPVIARTAARGLLEIGWKPPNEEVASRYWATLHDWNRCAQQGEAAVPVLVGALAGAPASERPDIFAGLARLGWEPPEQDKVAAEYWAAQGKWPECIAVGEPAVEVLDRILGSSPNWHERVFAGLALKELGQERTSPFARLDLVQEFLAVLEGSGDKDAKQAGLTELLKQHKLVDFSAKDKAEWCSCGYPTASVRKDGSRELLSDVLGKQESTASTFFYCPSCSLRQSSLSV